MTNPERLADPSLGMKLFYSDVLAPRKACAVAKYLEVPVEFVYLDLRQGEQKRPSYVALNPNGTVPTLIDGDQVLWEADAIMCHLSRRTGSDLWPGDNRQIEVLRWLSWNAQHFTRCGGALYFEGVIKPRFGAGPADENAIQSALVGFRRFAGILNDHLCGRAWLVGDGLTVADFSVAITLPYAAQARMPLDEFPEIRRWHDRLNTLDAWRSPFPVQH